MKKRCCGSNIVVTQNKLCCNNCDLACCISKLSLKPDDNTQIDFSGKQNHTRRKITIDNSVRYVPRSEQTKEKDIDRYKNVDPSILLKLFLKKHLDVEWIREAKLVLDELRRVSVISCEQYNEWFASCFSE